jgi:hypothetical protein
MNGATMSSFAVRLRDVLSTIEVTSVLASQDNRMRGLGEQLGFACLALPCDEALVALELATLGRLTVPGIASAEGWRPSKVEFLPSGTPFAFLLSGGSGFAAELEEDDGMLAALRSELQTTPRYGVFVPVRLGGSILGGAVLLREQQPLGDRELAMAERLAEVLSLTLESHRTERILLALFAELLPDLCAIDAPTSFASGLERYIHRLRVEPLYRERLALAQSVGRLAAQGPAESRLVGDILARVERYLGELEGGDGGLGAAEGPGLLDEVL